VATPQYVIKITGYGVDEFNYLQVVWELSNRFFYELGIEVLVEYENEGAIGDYLRGVGYASESTPQIIIEGHGGVRKVVDPDATSLMKAVEEMILRSVGKGEIKVVVSDHGVYDDGWKEDPIVYAVAA